MTDGLEEVRQRLESREDIPSDPRGNVAPLRKTGPKGPETLQPRARKLLALATWSGDIQPDLECDYLVKGWLNRGDLSVVFGPSNVGKSFLGVDIAHHVSKGREWGRRRVNKGRVLYLAAEGGATFRNRIAAVDDPEFWVISAPVTLAGKETQAQPLAEVLQHLAAVGGTGFDLVIVDTMSRVMGAGDENTAPDIADLIRNLDIIRRLTGAHVMLVHHIGKDAGRGARGHSSLRAAIDTEIELSRDDVGVITAEVTKQRDGPTGYRFDYTLRQVELGRDQDGDAVTTCVVEPLEGSSGRSTAVPAAALSALDILVEMLAEQGERKRRPEYPSGPCVPVHVWRDACSEPGRVSSSDDPENRRRAWRKCRDQLEAAKEICIRNDLVWKVER